MRKIIIRRKEVLNHLPKEIRAGAKVTIGSIYVGRQPLKGVEGEEAHKLLKDIIDVPNNHLDWPKKEKDFWASMRVKVPFEGVELDISTDENGTPFNTMDYLTYKWCLKHRLVATTKEEMETDGRKRFYIYDPEKDLLKKNAEVKVSKEADKEFIKLTGNVDKMKMLLRVLSIGSRPENLTDMEVENMLYELKNQSSVKFLKHAVDQDLEVRSELSEMIEYGVIRLIGNQHIYIDETIGENTTDAIVYFKNKKNSGAVNAMRAQLKELK
jgi:rubrerythrin